MKNNLSMLVTTKKVVLSGILLLFGLMGCQNLLSATFVVTSAADAGAGSLRQAIINANASPGADVINFNFASATTITLASSQQQITGQVTIDGYSNPFAAAGNLMIQVFVPAGGKAFDLAVGSDGSVIRGIVIDGGGASSFGVTAENSNNHTISGNYFGTNLAGNALYATQLQDCINLNTANNVTIGGTGGQIDRNIIAGASQDGIRVVSSTGVVIVNNYIGTDVTGNVNFGNTGNGVDAYNNSHNLRVGGTTLAERNVISGNHSNGVYINQSQSPIVKGNICGMGVNGTTMLGNIGGCGINISYTGTTATAAAVGGPTLAERNYTSCNKSFGIGIDHSPGTIIQNNWIGVDMATGLLDYGNNDAGITATNSSDVQCLNNVSSGNGNPGPGADGISIFSTSPRPIIKGNIIGLGIDGVTPLQNYGHGIECLTCDTGMIGGTTLAERNLISNTFLEGIQLNNSPGIRIYNNYIGTDITGMINNGGSQLGINVANSTNVLIGGASANMGNVISGNGQSGISVNGTSGGAVIKGNIVGLAVDGATPIKNLAYGIQITSNSANNCVVGGPTTLERNIISSNVSDGLFIGGTSTGHTVVNNYIGTDITGTIVKGNGGSGINLNIGNGGTIVSVITVDQNVISGNSQWGINFNTASSSTATRNKIGTDVTGTLKLGNGKEGVRFSGTSLTNILGGSLANANIVTDNNGAAGVLVESTGQKNTITFNSIYCNAGPGITLQGTANESVPPPVILVSGTNSINGTGTTNDVIHVYRNVKADGGVKCDCEGEIYIGTVTVVAGVWSLTHNLGLSTAGAASVTATQTTPLGSTSQFTPCSIPLPVVLTYFNAVKNMADQTVSLSWTTGSEKNNNYFEILRSEDGVNFQVIGTVAGAGNVETLTNYSFVDPSPIDGINYYKLKQVDYNGEASYSVIRTVDFYNNDLSVLPYENGFKIIVPGNQKTAITYEVYSMTGALVAKGTVFSGLHVNDVKLNLSPALYIVTVSSENNFITKKILLSE